MPPMAKISVIMVCRANICRSPMAEAMFRHRAQEMGVHKKFKIDSAGTKASQPGHKPDARAVRVMEEAGVGLTRIKARQVTVKDLVRNDYILVMDASNYDDLKALCPEEHQHKIELLMDYSDLTGESDIPDPYFGTLAGFEEVFRLVENSTGALLEHIVDSIT